MQSNTINYSVSAMAAILGVRSSHCLGFDYRVAIENGPGLRRVCTSVRALNRFLLMSVSGISIHVQSIRAVDVVHKT